MTEPEDLEEDLFADLYDADDSTTSPVAAPPTEPVVPNQTQSEQAPELPMTDDQPAFPPPDIPIDAADDANVQIDEEEDADDGMENWVTEQANGANQPQATSSSFGPNIKEDGYVKSVSEDISSLSSPSYSLHMQQR
ncbi:MAG: hypothetical protein Q9227_008471 [Pyrenula ochraceoflavens]